MNLSAQEQDAASAMESTTLGIRAEASGDFRQALSYARISFDARLRIKDRIISELMHLAGIEQGISS